MNNAFRVSCLVCVLLAFGCFMGCGSDDPASVVDVPEIPEDTNLGGSVGVYGNIGGTRPIVDTGDLVTVHVVHRVPDGATASAFRIQAPTGWVRVGTKANFPVAIGNIDDGISIAYGKCMSGSVHIMSVTYQTPGSTQTGRVFRVLPHSEWPGFVQVVDCNQKLLNDAIGIESAIALSLTDEGEDEEDRFQER
ncbi:MAG: hypothetical protein JSW58_13090 [Candidatus Latescibacterota bacterium]|nr:MAG: hypothetical protein JSW58_13090 [Candidatus Latescibacterota bacterium]